MYYFLFRILEHFDRVIYIYSNKKLYSSVKCQYFGYVFDYIDKKGGGKETIPKPLLLLYFLKAFFRLPVVF